MFRTSCVLSLVLLVTQCAFGADIRVGIIGCDTSHAGAFTNVFNQANPAEELAGIRVVAAFPTSSDDIPASKDRVVKFTKELEQKGVKIVSSMDELLRQVDAVLLESVDGRNHLELATAVINANKPLFIDKPLAHSLKDAVAILELAREKKVPCFSSSSLRFTPGVIDARDNAAVGKITGCDTFGPCTLEPHHPDLFWYGVHGVEMLFTVMGPGCESVTRTGTDSTDVVVGKWKDGRIGTFRGIREGAADYGATVFGSKSVARSGKYPGYKPLVTQIAKFFRTGEPPVNPEETLEIMAFMEGADESKKTGRAVTMSDVFARAQKPNISVTGSKK
ncbi:MAG: Gfo/Idh/MocA family oxidoreductase [Planctomycetota bacterium]|nr:Gfo/Idh/MocA family oxidoreductase [Planctomycetota bacterium]